MKKLMIACAMVAMAAYVQAAAMNWKIPSSTYDGKTVYAINGDFMTDAIAALSNDNNLSGSAQFQAFLSGKSYQTESGGSRAKTVGMENVGDYVTFIAFNDGVVDGKAYGISVASTAGHTYEQGTPPPALDFTAPLTGYTITEHRDDPGPIPPVVPEPTSAMLLLLGVAGLALKRKQA